MQTELESLVDPVVQLRRVDRGYTPAERAVALLADGRRVFAKHAVHEQVVGRLRQEQHMYEFLGPRSFLAEVLAWKDGAEPLLVLEDLSDATWPPPWDPPAVDAVLAALDEIAACPVPDAVDRLEDTTMARNGWADVLADPGPFFGLGLRDEQWLQRFGAILATAADEAPLAGDSLLHCDVRSDNLCIREGRALVIDWDQACVGNSAFDVAFWLPSLAAEGGPSPAEVMPECPPGVVAVIAGYFASQAGLPRIPHAPRVREVQLAQLIPSLFWVDEVFAR